MTCLSLCWLGLVGQPVIDLCEQQLQRRGQEGDIYPLLSFGTAAEINPGELRMKWNDV